MRVKHLLVLIVVISVGVISCKKEKSAGVVTIIKQWHPSGKVKTENIERSRSLPQYKNQRAIYDIASGMIKEGKTGVIISEGCEGAIDESFTEAHYGWDYKKLTHKKAAPEYADIVALPALKLKVRFGEKVNSVCGDSLKEMKENEYSLSDLRAFVGYYTRLKIYKEKPQQFKLFAESLLKKEKNKDKIDPIEFSRKKAMEALEKTENLIKSRNRVFVKTAKMHLKKNPVIIIGGIHVEDLKKKLKSENIDFKVIVPEGYPKRDQELFEMVRNILSKKK